MLKKKVFFPVLALAIIGGALATSNFVSAQDATIDQGPFQSVISKIAQKFNLNEADVKAVFDEDMNARHEEMKKQMEEKLTQAVKDGKITEAQKQAIQEKFAQPFMVKFKPTAGQEMSEEEMKTMHEQKKSEMDAWLSQNGLTHETLREVMGHPKGFGHGKKVLFMSH